MALAEIIRTEIADIPENTKQDFQTYFNELFNFVNPESQRGEPLDESQWEEQRQRFANLDIKAMIQYWPLVASHLEQHHNFYHCLEAFVLEGVNLSKQTQEDNAIKPPHMIAPPVVYNSPIDSQLCV